MKVSLSQEIKKTIMYFGMGITWSIIIIETLPQILFDGSFKPTGLVFGIAITITYWFVLDYIFDIPKVKTNLKKWARANNGVEGS